MGNVLIISGIIILIYGVIRIFNTYSKDTYKKTSLLYILGKRYENQENEKLLQIRGLIGIVLGIGFIFIGINLNNAKFSLQSNFQTFDVSSNSDLSTAIDIGINTEFLWIENLSKNSVEIKLERCGYETPQEKFEKINYKGDLDTGRILTIKIDDVDEEEKQFICDKVRIVQGEFVILENNISLDLL